MIIHSETCLKQSLKNRQNKGLIKSCGTLMQVKSTANCSMGAFCNTFDLHKGISHLKNLFFVLFWVAATRQSCGFTVKLYQLHYHFKVILGPL